MSAANIIVLASGDDVGVALHDIQAGEPLITTDGALQAAAQSAIPMGHKVTLHALQKGAPIIKYGQVIGEALRDVAEGSHVHSDALGFGTGTLRHAVTTRTQTPYIDNISSRQTFMGYKRANGLYGTRNYIGVMASVNCSTTVCRKIAELANQQILPRYKHALNGFVPLVHGQGCGSAATGDGALILKRTLAGYLRHPNFGAVLLIGLGCEVNQIMLYGAAGRDAPVTAFNIQDVGGSGKAVSLALEKLEMMAANVAKQQREPCPLSGLLVGLQCGGSDGLSGITANPALGVAVDKLIAQGASAYLSETPEIWGAEHLLTARASDEVAQKLDARLKWWANYVATTGASLDNNPSPGNKRGGLTTILEKSLGAVAKGGQSPLVDVVEYACHSDQHGLIFMDTPGYDPVSATGQVAGGANLIAFTTGRGSCFGCRPAPSIKIASNSALATRMAEDMDVDAGRIVLGSASVADVGDEIFNLLLDVASGAPTKSEAFGYGDDEFVPWHIGAVL